ncbi:unnamed protein product [Oikopleura dioica]|uniref:Peptidase S1 domain-containing protein n=1 Tax=Oikopleura dioica TaxID=34765 RepID=E4YIC4_OIKDI|nr:unnamed protein product [Oikopleura dioica]
MKFAWIVAISGVASVNALRKLSSFIVGGDEVAPNSEPYVISLQRSGAHFCGASLAGYLNKAITAGHCHNSYGVTAVAGAHRIELYESRSQSRSVTQFIVHPSYNSYLLENDIAIIKLSSPFVENEYVKPLFLPRQEFQDWLPHNSPVRVCGWGNTVPGRRTIANGQGVALYRHQCYRLLDLQRQTTLQRGALTGNDVRWSRRIRRKRRLRR